MKQNVPSIYLAKETDNTMFKVGYTTEPIIRTKFNNSQIKIAKARSKMFICGQEKAAKSLDRKIKNLVKQHRLKKQYPESGGTEWFDIKAWDEVVAFLNTKETKKKYDIQESMSISAHEKAVDYDPIKEHAKYANDLSPFSRYDENSPIIKRIPKYRKTAPTGLFDDQPVPKVNLPYVDFAFIASLPSLGIQRQLSTARMKKIDSYMTSDKVVISTLVVVTLARIKELGGAIVNIDGSCRTEEIRRGIIEKATTGYTDTVLPDKIAYVLHDYDTLAEGEDAYYSLDNSAAQETSRDKIGGAYYKLDKEEYLEHVLLAPKDTNQTLINTLELSGTMSKKLATDLLPTDRVEHFIPQLDIIFDRFNQPKYPSSFLATTLPLMYAFADNAKVHEQFLQFIEQALMEFDEGICNKKSKTGTDMFINEFYQPKKDKDKPFTYYQVGANIKQHHATTIGLVIVFFMLHLAGGRFNKATIGKKLLDKDMTEFYQLTKMVMTSGALVEGVVY